MELLDTLARHDLLGLVGLLIWSLLAGVVLLAVVWLAPVAGADDNDPCTVYPATSPNHVFCEQGLRFNLCLARASADTCINEMAQGPS